MVSVSGFSMTSDNTSMPLVAMCQENSFVDLVVKLVKYTAQREEMLRIYAKGLAENKWVRLHNWVLQCIARIIFAYI